MASAAQGARARGQDRRRGHAVMEFALLSPWILLLFAGIFDFGMYCKALIITENAARVAVLQTSTTSDGAGDVDLACSAVRDEMKSVANAAGLTGCTALPLIVGVNTQLDSEGFTISRVSVTYQTPQYFRLPFVPGRMTVTRNAQMRARP